MDGAMDATANDADSSLDGSAHTPDGGLPEDAQVDASSDTWMPRGELVSCAARDFVAESFNLPNPIDYLAIYLPAQLNDGGTGSQLTHQFGERCATASNPAACQFDAFALDEPGGSNHYLIVTTGDEIIRIPDGEEGLVALRALLGEVDTLAEAVLVALLNGFRNGFKSACGDNYTYGLRALTVNGGYELEYSSVPCPVYIHSSRARVAADATYVDLGKRIYPLFPDASCSSEP